MNTMFALAPSPSGIPEWVAQLAAAALAVSFPSGPKVNTAPSAAVESTTRPRQDRTRYRRRMFSSSVAHLFRRRIDRLPVILHADDGPTFCGCLVERLVELADMGAAIISPLAVPIGMMDDAHEGGACARRGP